MEGMDDLECFCRTRCIGCSADVALKFFELSGPNFFETPEGINLNQLKQGLDHRCQLFSVIHVIYLSKNRNI